MSQWDWFAILGWEATILPALVASLASASPLLDLPAAVALQAMDVIGDVERWLDRTPPMIVRDGREGELRVGMFHWATDRDAFIRDLLGNPVPRRPRYARAGPEVPLRLSGNLQEVQEELGFTVRESAELYGLSRDDALDHARSVGSVVHRIADWAPGVGRISDAVLEHDPEAWAAGPPGRLLLPVARGAPRWRAPNLSTQWAAAFDMGVLGIMGIALWAPGPYGMRPHRRQMAAHLRYLFDYHVSPWNRLAVDRSRREAVMLYWRDRIVVSEDNRPTIRKVCAAVRRRWPRAYDDEASEVTLRRLFRLNVVLRRGQRTAGIRDRRRSARAGLPADL